MKKPSSYAPFLLFSECLQCSVLERHSSQPWEFPTFPTMRWLSLWENLSVAPRCCVLLLTVKEITWMFTKNLSSYINPLLGMEPYLEIWLFPFSRFFKNIYICFAKLCLTRQIILSIWVAFWRSSTHWLDANFFKNNSCLTCSVQMQRKSLAYSSSCNQRPPISRVLIGWYFIFCSST